MPAGAPSGLDRRFFVSMRILENSGADAAVNFQGAAIDPVSGDIFIAGNNDYVGLMQDGIFGELVQGAVLPATNNAMVSAKHNKSAGGWLVMDGVSAVFRGPADLASAWTVITPPAATSRDDIVEYNGAILTATAKLSIPDRDIEFSIDNGANWDSNPGDFTGIGVNLAGIFTNAAQNRLVVTAAAGPNAAFTNDTGNPPYTWTLWPFDTAGIRMNHAAISDDGQKAVIVANNGRISTTSGFSTFFTFPAANNPFQVGTTGNVINAVVYVAAMGGFIIVTSVGSYMAFIPENDMQQIFVGSALTEAVLLPLAVAVSDGVQALFPGVGNEAMCTLRTIGQIGKTGP